MAVNKQCCGGDVFGRQRLKILDTHTLARKLSRGRLLRKKNGLHRKRIINVFFLRHAHINRAASPCKPQHR